MEDPVLTDPSVSASGINGDKWAGSRLTCHADDSPVMPQAVADSTAAPDIRAGFSQCGDQGGS